MAAYSQSITLAQLNKIAESWNNVYAKIHCEMLFTILVAEFAAAETAGLGSYTVTSGLQASLESTMFNAPNALRVELMKRWITYLVTEFTSVATDGLSYTVTTDSTTARNELLDLLNQSISYLNDVETKIAFHQINDLLNTEFGLMAAAS